MIGALLSLTDPSADFKAATARIAPDSYSEDQDADVKLVLAAATEGQTKSGVNKSNKDTVVIGGQVIDESHLLSAPRPGRDVRAMSPRELSEFAHELYIEGVIKWEEYRTMGFPVELNRQYAETVGALTGEKAEPDKPRDMIQDWEDRLSFERKYFPEEATTPRRTEKVLNVLKWHEIPKVHLNI
ncbi:MAG: hypothetical protein A2516_07580 [Alphaproteobacteria bacterium RIFOXYD12_FULL_60_8]|nr:MAG: hypothetical protein A2516_07580 [Alphaproteobacteria bacterium RIFOXYD12_FULL_60_8]